MKISNRRLVSPWNHYALMAMLATCFAFYPALNKATNLISPPYLTQSSWSATTNLSNNSGTQLEVAVEFFLTEPTFTYQISFSTEQSQLTFTLESNSETSLPPNAEIAVLELTNPVTSKVQRFRVRSDGGGMIIAIDEF